MRELFKSVKKTIKRWILIFLPRIAEVNYHGFRLFYSRGDYLISRCQTESLWPNMFKLLREELSRHQSPVLLDIGAHNGIISLFAKHSCSSVVIHAFEPSPFQFEMLQKTVLSNKISNFYVYRLAVGDRSGEVSFFICPRGDEPRNGLTSRVGTEEIRVQMVALDDWVKQNNLTKLDILKIDVEFSEFPLLKGAESTIKKFRPVIFIEIVDNLQSHRLLESWGYSIKPIFDDIGNRDFIARPSDRSK